MYDFLIFIYIKQHPTLHPIWFPEMIGLRILRDWILFSPSLLVWLIELVY